MADDTKQNETEYQPTLGEKKLLEVMLDPEHRLKKVTEWCSIAGVDRSTYYRAIEKPGFMAYANAEAMRRVERYIPTIISAYVREAQRGSIQHGNVLLDMAGIYTQRTRTELTGKDGGAIEYAGILPQDEVNRRLAEMGLLPQPAEKGEKPEEKPN